MRLGSKRDLENFRLTNPSFAILDFRLRILFNGTLITYMTRNLSVKSLKKLVGLILL